jgi:hypothetical protein
MTLKNAAADLPLGGGKAVILGRPGREDGGQLRAMGRAIDTLGGRYWTAEDMGMSPADMQVVRQETAFVAGLPDGPMPRAIPRPGRRAACSTPCASRRSGASAARDLAGRRVAIQGLGHVGWHLAKLLRAAGAELKVSDIDTARAEQAAWTFGATAVAPEDILTAPADILAPCAIGGVITEEVAARHARARGLRGGEQSTGQRRGGRRPARARHPLRAGLRGQWRRDHQRRGRDPAGARPDALRQRPAGGAGGMMAHILDRPRRADAPHRIADRIVAERLTPSDEAA